jgi:hypothetical protein
MLQRAGRTGLMSYELHVPMVVNRHILAEAVAMVGRSSTAGHAIAKRTLYGNLAGVGGERAHDVKAMRAKDGLPESGLPFLSTSPASWTGLAGGWIRRLLAAPCRYERVPSGHLYQPPARSAARGRR